MYVFSLLDANQIQTTFVYASTSALSLAMKASLRAATLALRSSSVSLRSVQRFLVAGFLCSVFVCEGSARMEEWAFL